MVEPVPDTRSVAEVAGTIAALCADLVRLAQLNQFDVLAYLLGVAQLEADAIRQGRPNDRDACAAQRLG